MNFDHITLWFCHPCQNYMIDPGLRAQYSEKAPTCAKCKQTIKDFIEYEQLKTGNQPLTQTERTSHVTSRGFAFTKAISTKS